MESACPSIIIVPPSHSDENWWKGQTQLGTGLFPASFVSANLSADPEPCEYISVWLCHLMGVACLCNDVMMRSTTVVG